MWKNKEESGLWNSKIMPRKVVFDFNRVVFMDSAGIGLILGRYKMANNFGGRLEMINVNEKIRRVFEMSGILKLIPIVQDFENKMAN